MWTHFSGPFTCVITLRLWDFAPRNGFVGIWNILIFPNKKKIGISSILETSDQAWI